VALLLAYLFGAGALAASDPVADATAMIERREYGAALRLLEPLLKQGHDNIPGQMAAATACLGRNDARCADEHLRWVERLAPNTPGYQLLLGRRFLLRAHRATGTAERESDTARALEAFSKALAESPGNPKVLEARASALRLARRVPEARDAYDAWIAAEPRNPLAYGAAAALLAEAGMWAEASGLVDRAPKDDPKLARYVRLAVLRSGVAVAPWEAIRPMLETVEAQETDPTTRLGLCAYRAVLMEENQVQQLAVLDYLDADPDDHLDVKAVLTRKKSRATPIPVTADDTGGVVLPKLLTKSTVVYPDLAKRARIEGKIIVYSRILKSGHVGSAHVVSSSNPIFNSSAVAAVLERTYAPAMVGGEPFEMPFMIQVEFLLH